jgi:dihydroorotase
MRVHALSNPHTHWRELEMLIAFMLLAIQGGARLFGPMPNTDKGLTRADDIIGYRNRALSAIPQGMQVDIIPIGQITEATTPEDIEAWHRTGIKDGKIYPKDRTTKSQLGVVYYHRLLPAVKRAGELGMRIHFHPEHPDLLIGNHDAEFQFVTMVEMFLEETNAVLIWEHATDARLIPFWLEWAKTGRFFLTITAHHLLEYADSTLGYTAAICKPTYKTYLDRHLLLEFVKQDHSWVMAIGDDAPHDRHKKQVPGPCACGAYTAPFLLPLFAHALDDLLETPEGQQVFQNFTSTNARKLYGIKTPVVELELVKEPFKIPALYKVGDWEIEPFWAGRDIKYSINEFFPLD